MENVNNPNDIVRPQGSVEKIASLFQKGGVTKDLIERLRKMDTAITFPDGKKLELTLDDVKKEINRDVKYNKTYNPDGFRYNSVREADRKRSKLIEAALQKKDYKALIKPMLDTAIEEWRMAERMDAVANAMSPQKRADMEAAHKHNVEEEAEITRREKETGQRQEHGIPPYLTEIGGESYRVRSQAFLAYAIILAKKVLSESR